MDARVAGTIVSGIFLGQRCLNDPDSHHECQTVPSLSASLNPDLVNHNLLLDTWDLAALIAPRPLLIQWGGEDQFYNDEPNRSCRIQASQRSHDIYAKLGAKDRIETHLIPGLPHAFDNANAFEFLAKYSLSRSSH